MRLPPFSVKIGEPIREIVVTPVALPVPGPLPVRPKLAPAEPVPA